MACYGEYLGRGSLSYLLPLFYEHSFHSFNQTTTDSLGTSPLPVEVGRFLAKPHQADALQCRATPSKKSNDHCEVAARAGGLQLRRIGQVLGYGSTTQAPKYHLVDLAIARYAAPMGYFHPRRMD